jgi:glycosyltransferase involved in cell wall biosynthesis
MLALARAIRSAVRRHRPDILHLHSTFAGLAGRVAVRSSGVKVVYCAHCWSFDREMSKVPANLLKAYERLVSRWADTIVNVSPHEAALLSGFAKRKVTCVMSGIRDLEGACRPPVPHTGPVRLLFLGRLDQQKGADLLLREIESVPPSRAILRVIGSPVVDQVATRIPPHVEVLPWVPRHEVHDHIAAADAIVMPSRWEGLPLVALEAMRAGRPILASDRGPFPYIIEHGRNGLVMPIDAPGFLSRALDELERLDLVDMSAHARRTYELRFKADRMNLELLDVYRRTLGVDTQTRALLQPSGRHGNAIGGTVVES